MQRFLKWTSVQTCPNPICYIFVGFPIWVSGISDTGKRCFGIRGLECCFSLIGVGFPNLEFHELALAFMKCRSAPDIGRVCVDAGNNGPSLKWQLVWARLLSSAW